MPCWPGYTHSEQQEQEHKPGVRMRSIFLRARLQQLLPALLLALSGLGVLIGGSHYQTGSLTQMGPGFMPALLGSLLLLLSLLVVVIECKALPGVHTRLPLRPLLCAGASIVAWALLVDITGFVPACLLQLLLAFAAMPQANWRQVVLCCVVITALAYVLFVPLLGIPLQAFGW